MNHSSTIIISPSGNFYGSEQVLFDFLTETSNVYTVFVPRKGRLIEKLRTLGRHKIFPFQNVKLLYLNVFFLLVRKRAKVVYSNEGGHIKYIGLLASIFKKARFINHIRIVEDTQASRIRNLPANVLLVSISRYITSLLNTVDQRKIITIHDPYISKGDQSTIVIPTNNHFIVGIIGRVTPTKGLDEIISFCDFLEQKKTNEVLITLFGDVDKENEIVSVFLEKSRLYKYVKVIFKGFIEAKEEIYSSVDIVIHLSKIEPLGRIFFESLDYGRPFIGFNNGGIGEIAKKLQIEDCMITDTPKWTENLYIKITQIHKAIPQYELAKKNYLEQFSAKSYCKALEDLIL